MLQDDETLKLYAAGNDEDDRDLDAEDREFVEDEEEEEESYSGSDDLTLDDADYEAPARSSAHAEEADLFARPSTPAAPYQPPQRLSAEPTRNA
ncbi:MAG TPA: hypothetical protein VFE06_02585, partial [Acidobacteriaceae bacterium]|nr:hypothetical protein [Acidobacteriaceae bacterium]